MEILRPQNLDGLSHTCIKGKIKITTRCLWLDKGKLLDALYKAAHAALSSCPINCPLTHMERTVSEVLRKMVRKYSSKRPEVIAVAVENPAAVLSDELKAKLSGKFHGGFGLSATNKAVDTHPKKIKSSRKLEDASNGAANFAENLVEEEILDSQIAGRVGHALLGFQKSTVHADMANPSSVALEESESFWESFIVSSLNEREKADNGSMPKKRLKLTENENENSSVKFVNSPIAQPEAHKPAKRNKWKPEEIKKLIKIRSELDSKFQAVKARMVLWEEVSANMLSCGHQRTPGQCKSLWASLVQKYEENKTVTESKMSWPYFGEMDQILSAHEEVTK